MTPLLPPASSDPRTVIEPGAERDIRPVIQRPRAGLSGAAIAAIASVAALGLFGVLEARRERSTTPTVVRSRSNIGASAAPPPLYLPPQPASRPTPAAMAAPVAMPMPPWTPRIVSEAVRAVPSYPAISSIQSAAAPAPPRSSAGAALVLDTSSPAISGDEPQEKSRSGTAGERMTGLSTNRVRAAMFANRSTTVPQGTLIPAVLETAFDSTSPGFARALVQKDIYGFDGTRVLIPRGSRLVGEYGADTARGQKRAVILWSRLIRPDGVTIALLSPAADPEGRGGVKADVDTHFLERFSGAILQSVLDVGVALAARSSRSPVLVALPGSTTAVTGGMNNRATEIAPTLRVPAGRSVSVFVARDLDFTQAESRP